MLLRSILVPGSGLILGLALFGRPADAMGAKPLKCISTDEASRLANKDVCITAHVYDVVELPDGRRFLDVCSPETPDEECRFTIVSYEGDRPDVGELSRYKNADVKMRGIVESVHGRAGIVLNHQRQFRGGPPKFRPNPRLMLGFDGDNSRPGVSDPNLRSHGSARSFMNSRSQERVPAK